MPRAGARDRDCALRASLRVRRVRGGSDAECLGDPAVPSLSRADRVLVARVPVASSLTESWSSSARCSMSTLYVYVRMFMYVCPRRWVPFVMVNQGPAHYVNCDNL